MHWFWRAVISLVVGAILSVWLTGPVGFSRSCMASPKLLETPHKRIFTSVYGALKPKLAPGQEWKWQLAHGTAYAVFTIPIGLVIFGVWTWRYRAKKPTEVRAEIPEP